MLELELLAILPDAEKLIQWGGVGLIAALVFIETGFLVGLIVPGGETLLFSAGLFAGLKTLDMPVWWLIPLLIVMAFAGDLTGYGIGRKLGKRLHNKKDSLLFRREYLEKSEKYYHKHPRRALIFGRFLPIIRTFNPLLSGSSGMDIKKFMLLSGFGGCLYISSIILAGYFLGQAFPKLGDYVGYIFMGVVILVLGSLFISFYREHRKTAS
ncbi:MAG: DedA family protein [Adhaeribacter sp.]